MSPVIDSLDLGPMTQLAWVVDDLDAAERQIRLAYGCTAWTRLPDIAFGPEDCTYRGAPAGFTADVSLAYRDDLQLELIRPTAGDSIYTEFLVDRGPGLHHVCFEVDDVSAAVDRAASAGIDCVQRGAMAGGGIEFAYLDVSAAGAGYVEVARLREDMRAFFEALRAG